jgi:hypothetical protein
MDKYLLASTSPFTLLIVLGLMNQKTIIKDKLSTKKEPDEFLDCNSISCQLLMKVILRLIWIFWISYL